MNYLLYDELKKRFEIDQRATKLPDPNFSLDKFETIALENTSWLKAYISREGWPSEEVVGV